MNEKNFTNLSLKLEKINSDLHWADEWFFRPILMAFSFFAIASNLILLFLIIFFSRQKNVITWQRYALITNVAILDLILNFVLISLNVPVFEITKNFGFLFWGNIILIGTAPLIATNSLELAILKYFAVWKPMKYSRMNNRKTMLKMIFFTYGGFLIPLSVYYWLHASITRKGLGLKFPTLFARIFACCFVTLFLILQILTHWLTLRILAKVKKQRTNINCFEGIEATKSHEQFVRMLRFMSAIQLFLAIFTNFCCIGDIGKKKKFSKEEKLSEEEKR